MIQPKQWWSDAAALVGRAMVVIGLIPNGIGKIMEFGTLAAGMGGKNTFVHGHPFPGDALVFFPFPQFFLTCSIIFDLVGSALILVGLFTRPVAAWMFVYCSLAVIIYHSAFFTGGTEGMTALLRNLPMFGGFLLLAALGPGRWSLDAKRQPAIAGKVPRRQTVEA